MIKNKKQLFAIVATFVIMSFVLGWKLSFILTSAIIIHEFGHIMMAKVLGYSVGAVYLVPLFGGISSIAAPKSYRDDALISLMGPMVGFCFALILALIGNYYNFPIVLAASALVTILNIVNLIPFSIMDGSFIVEAFVMSINRTLGTLILFILNGIFLAVVIKYGSLLFIIIAVIGSFVYLNKLIFQMSNPPDIVRLNWGQAFVVLTLLLVTIGIMLLSISLTKEVLLSPEKYIALIKD